jgi:hypothetical protein
VDCCETLVGQSLKLVSGTRQRYCGFSQARQNGEETLRPLVTALLPSTTRPWLASRSPGRRQHESVGALRDNKIGAITGPRGQRDGDSR